MLKYREAINPYMFILLVINMKGGNIVQEKSFEFAKLIVALSKELSSKKIFTIKDQVLRSGTSIGANIEEAIGSRSKREFYAKISIAYFEARETFYWLRLLKETEKIRNIDVLFLKCEELLKIIGRIQISLKENRNS